jgi:hypothetical protein
MWLHGDRRRRRTEQPCDLPSVERHTGARLAWRLLSLRRRCASLERFGDQRIPTEGARRTIGFVQQERPGSRLRGPDELHAGQSPTAALTNDQPPRPRPGLRPGFSFASARVDSSSRAETPQSATKQARRPGFMPTSVFRAVGRVLSSSRLSLTAGVPSRCVGFVSVRRQVLVSVGPAREEHRNGIRP